MRFSRYIVFFISLSSSLFLFSSFVLFHTDFIALINDRLANYYVNSSLEKVYVHTDREVYNVGDDIWFQAYVRNFSNNQLSVRSRKLRLVLIDSKGDTLIKKYTYLNDYSVASGVLELLKPTISGDHYLYAYTSRMEFFREAPVFKKKIRIQDPNNNGIITEVKMGSGLDQNTSIDLSIEFNRSKFNQKGAKLLIIDSLKDTLNIPIRVRKGLAKLEFTLPDNHSFDSRFLIEVLGNDGNTFIEEINIPVLKPIDLQFFPEGGDMILGLNNNLAFKAIDSFGQPVDIEGAVLDESGKVITNFSTDHSGMGIFNFTPERNDYHVKITKSSEKFILTDFELPKPKTSGYTLITNILDEIINVKINGTRDLATKEFTLVVLQGGRMIHSRSESLEINKESEIRFSTDLLRTGISKISLFDSNNVLRNERLVYINKDAADINLTLNKHDFEPRQKVEINVSSASYANASLSVTKVPYTIDKSQSIVSHFLLSSELRGNVFNPSRYFDPSNESRLKELDLVMMTNGWRSYEWESILFGEETSVEEEKTYGKWLVKDDKGRLMSNKKFFVVSKLSQKTFEIETDEEGIFYHNVIDDELKLLPTQNKSNYALAKPLLQPSSGDFNKKDINKLAHAIKPTIESMNNTTEFDNRSITQTRLRDGFYNIPTVVVEERKLYDNATLRQYDLPERYIEVLEHKMVKTLFNEELIGAPDLVSALRRVNGGIRFSHHNPAMATEVYTSRKTFIREYSNTNRTPMDALHKRRSSEQYTQDALLSSAILFIVNDGMPTPNFQLIYNDFQSASNIVSITYGEGVYVKTLNSNAENGVFYIYTEEYLKKKKVDIFTDVDQGIVPVKRFYKPNYELSSPSITDVRKTIHWDSELILDPGTRQLEFYLGDLPGRYQVELEGITDEGRPFYKLGYLNLIDQ